MVLLNVDLIVYYYVFMQFHYSGHICVYFVQLYYLVLYVFIYHVLYECNTCMGVLPEINFTYLLISAIFCFSLYMFVFVGYNFM